MDVVAEGVETTKQLAQLRALKCEYAQGYLFSEPVSGADAEKLIQAVHPFKDISQGLLPTS